MVYGDLLLVTGYLLLAADYCINSPFEGGKGDVVHSKPGKLLSNPKPMTQLL